MAHENSAFAADWSPPRQPQHDHRRVVFVMLAVE
jgi:hypothetical protein